MDIADKLLDAARSLAATATATATALAAVSLYLVSRAVGVSLEKVNPFDTAAQGVQFDLPISFLTLSAVWPAIIAGLALVLQALVARERSTMKALARAIDGTADDVSALNGLSLATSPGSRERDAFEKLVTVLPTAALLLHLIALALAAYRTFVGDEPVLQWVVAGAVLAIAIAATGVALNCVGGLRRLLQEQQL